MKSLHGETPTPELHTILTRPSRAVAYSDAPEYVRTYPIAKQGSPVSPFFMHILGKQPETRTLMPLYPVVPDLEIHELSDTIFYDGILYSKQGNYFPDSMRRFTSQNRIRLSYGPTSKLRHLGNGYCLPFNNDGTRTTVDCDPILMSCFTSHMVYGHWLLEALPSLWAWPHVKKLAQGAPVKLLMSPIPYLPKYMKDFMKPLGIGEHDCYFPSHCVRCKTIFMPTKSYMHMEYVSDAAKEMWRTIARYYLPQATMDPIDKIYISRRKIVRRRSLDNEEDCEALFARYGFTIVHPQDLPLADQILLFAHATHIAGPVGSGVHNVVFSLKNDQLKTLFFGPPDYTSYRAITCIEQAFGRNAYFVFGSERVQSKGPWHLDINELNSAVEQWLAQ